MAFGTNLVALTPLLAWRTEKRPTSHMTTRSPLVLMLNLSEAIINGDSQTPGIQIEMSDYMLCCLGGNINKHWWFSGKIGRCHKR